MIEVSVPGKIILTGEHAIFQTGIAITAAINLRSKGTFQQFPHCLHCKRPECRISVGFDSFVFCFGLRNGLVYLLSDILAIQNDLLFSNELNNNATSVQPTISTSSEQKLILKFAEDTAKIIDKCLLYTQLDMENGCLIVKTELKVPFGSGLGSSAVFSSIMAGGFITMAKHKTTCINDLAFECEKVFHASPSGIDNTTVITGGLCLFNGGKLDEMIDGIDMKFLIVNSGKVKNTKAILATLNQLYKNAPYKKEAILREIGNIGVKMKDYLHDFVQFQTMISKNHQLLHEYGVSSTEIEQIIQHGKKFGLTGKLSGAGCGGCVIFPFKERIHIEQYKMELEYESFECCIDNSGIIIYEN